MKKYNLEINQNDLSLIHLALSSLSNGYRNTRVKYTPEELTKILDDEDFEPFAEQQQEIRDFRKRLPNLEND